VLIDRIKNEGTIIALIANRECTILSSIVILNDRSEVKHFTKKCYLD
jgi:hypothetical protein